MFNPVTTLPRLRVSAWQGDPSARIVRFPGAVDILDALEAEYKTDAMILGYGGDHPDGYPRLGAAAAAYYAVRPDEAPMLTVAMFDVDTPGHEPSTSEWVQAQVALLTPEQRRVWAWYRTKHGMRFVARLSRPVPLLQANDLLARLFDELDARGVDMDAACKRWYRLYRAPKARGLDYEFDYAPLRSGASIDVDAMGPLDEAKAAHFGPIAVGAMPTDGVPTKAPTKTDCAQALGAKHPLASTLAKGQLSAPIGRRHAVLLSAAGQIADVSKTDNPRVVFDLLDYASSQMGKDREELWRLCEWAVARSVGAREALAEEQTEAADRLVKAIGARSKEEVQARVVLDAGVSYFILDEFSGGYVGPISHDHQLPRELALHAPTLAAEYAYAGVSKSEIMFHLASRVERVVYTYNAEEAGYDRDTLTFSTPVAQPCPDMFAEFDAEVDGWLRAFGEADRLLDWLAAYPLFHRPTCALYICAPPAIGKGMLAAGLARLYSPYSEVTPYATLLEKYTAGLRTAPLVWADEQVPKGAFGQGEGSSLFRRMVGTGVHSVEEKYEVKATLRGYPRILVTANNANAFEFGSEEIQRDDLHAIQERIGYIDMTGNEAPKDYLEALAAKKGYDTPTHMTEEEGWVTGGRIARHVMWLSEHRAYRRGKRFLVEGWESMLFDNMLSSVGSTEAVALAIILAILNPVGRTSTNPGVRWFGGEIFANAPELAAQWTTLTGLDKHKPPSIKAVTAAIQRLAVTDVAKDSEKQRRLAPVYGGKGAPRYWRLDPGRVAMIARRLGLCSASEIHTEIERDAEPNYDPNWDKDYEPSVTLPDNLVIDPEAGR